MREQLEISNSTCVNEDEEAHLENISIVFLTMCIFSSFFAFLAIILYKKYYSRFLFKQTARVIMLISITDILRCFHGIYMSVNYIKTKTPIENVAFCDFLGVWYNIFNDMTLFGVFMISLFYYKCIHDSLARFEKKAGFAVFCFAIIPFFEENYGVIDGGLICWTQGYYTRIICLYIPFWVTFLGSLFCIIKGNLIQGVASDWKLMVFPLIIFLCWGPGFLRRVLENDGCFIYWSMYMMYISFPLAGILNPLAYLFIDDDFRKRLFDAIRNFICCDLGKNNKDDIGTPSTQNNQVSKVSDRNDHAPLVVPIINHESYS